MKTLHQLATDHGQLAFPIEARTVPANTKPYLWKHLVADRLHGWSNYEYHYQDDKIELSDDDYLAALQAAEDGLTPHEPAVRAVE